MLSQSQGERSQSKRRVSLWADRHDRHIANPQIINSLDLEIRVHHTSPVRAIHAHSSTFVGKHTKTQMLWTKTRVATELLARSRGREGLRVDKGVSDVAHNVFHGALNFVREGGSSNVKYRIQARDTENRIFIVKFPNELEQNTDCVIVLLFILGVLWLCELALSIVEVRSVERCRTSSEEEIGIDSHRDETLFSTDLEMGLEVEGFLSDASVFLFGESCVADVVVNESLANKVVCLLQTTVQGDRRSPNGSGG